ncbi:MAG: tetratricopeptide repeat protein [Vicinamibacteria bacterium]
MSILAIAIGAALAGAPAVDGPAELQPARLYLAGRRAEALGALGSRGEVDMRRELGQLFKLRTVKEPSAGALLRAALMLHTDRAQAGRGQAPGAESPRACGIGDDDVLARSIAGYAVEREDARAFVRRWFVAMAWQSQWDLCLDDLRSWTREGLKWFPRDAELSLVRGLGAEASVRFRRADDLAGPQPATATHDRAQVVRDLEEAHAAYAAALAASPDLLEARAGLGRTLWRQGKLDAARDELARVARDARDPEGLYLAQLFLARVHDDASRPAEAEQAYRDALTAFPAGQAAAFGLAELRARGGDDGGSRAAVEQALATGEHVRDPYTFHHLGPAGRAQQLMDALREEALQ